MKIRKCFVSNSSSSSFVVAFPKGFEVTLENVKNAMFPTDTKTVYYYDYQVPTDAIAERVFREMSDQRPNNFKVIGDMLQGGCYDDTPDYPDTWHKSTEECIELWRQHDVVMQEYYEKKVPLVLKEYEHYDLYAFDYSDNEGNFECVMEHGDIFAALKHQRFSHH